MTIYDSLIAKAIGGSGGGGGGDLPFVRAQITVNADSGNFAPGVSFSDDLTGASPYVTGFFFDAEEGVLNSEQGGFGLIPRGESETKTAYLVKQHAMCFIDASYIITDYSVTGDAEVKTLDVGGTTYYYVEITGDCTITIS